MMRKYISLVGRDYWPPLNSLWSVLKEGAFQPEELMLLTEERYEKRAQRLSEDMGTLLKNYGITLDIDIKTVKDGDFKGAGEEVKRAMNGYDEDTFTLDISGGRKPLVAGALINQGQDNLEHVFYLYTADPEKARKPYPEIKGQHLKLMDFKSLNGGEK
ncbi:MAG: hypothetical protein ACQESD_06550 [Thermoplasmatota archaeon]